MIKQVSITQVMSFFLFIFFLFIGRSAQAAKNTTTPIKFKVGVVLDLNEVQGKLGLSCMNMALDDFYANHTSYKTRLVLYPRDSNKEVVDAASAAIDLLKNVKVQAIIGPIKSSQANFIAGLGNKAQVPIISYSASSPAISPIETPYFIRTAQNDSSQVQSIASIVKAYGWREVILIYEDTEFGKGILRYLTDALQEIDTRVSYRSVISPSPSDHDKIHEELLKLQTMQTAVFILHMTPLLGSELFMKAKEVGMMSKGYSWIITDGLANFLNSANSSVISSMQGVLGVRPYIPPSNGLKKFKARWERNFRQENNGFLDGAKMNIYGLWAYDTIWALALAIEKVGITRNSSFLKPKSMKDSTSSGVLNFDVSEIGRKLLQEISNINFTGLSGEFHMLGGQLQSLSVEIVNVVDNRTEGIGFWTPKDGIFRRLSDVNTSSYSTSNYNLSVKWPGESTDIPKGWFIPSRDGKRSLRIGVPAKDVISEFVNVTRNNATNTTNITGYSIDVFKTVIKNLSYELPYEFIPFHGTYDELIYQVYLKRFDAAVGDITIIANRSLYVDFTLPYTESGVSMIVPVRDDGRKNAWIFLKPLNWDLWLTTGVFFVFTGFVIWVLEHRINEDFRGPRNHQLGTILWFAFSTLVFSHKEKVVSNLARFVVIIWVFVVLILTSSYTASLTSMLTVQRLEPTIQDIQELMKSSDKKVGYRLGSFVLGFLERMHIDKSQLAAYNSAEQFDEALSKGSHDGISAAFDEMPYIKLILATYGSKYTIVGPTYKTDGFGFAFPRGSPLVPDMSTAILHVREGNSMEKLEEIWFGKQNSSPDPTTTVFSNSLTLKSFSGLFLIAAVSSTLALLIFSTTFIYEHRQTFSSSNPNSNSIWKRIVAMAKHFDQKDLSSNAFRKDGIQENRDNVDNIDAYVVASPNVIISTNPPSPWSNWNQGEENFSPAHDDQSLSNANVDNPAQEISTIEGTLPSGVSNCNNGMTHLSQT